MSRLTACLKKPVTKQRKLKGEMFNLLRQHLSNVGTLKLTYHHLMSHQCGKETMPQKQCMNQATRHWRRTAFSVMRAPRKKGQARALAKDITWSFTVA